MTFRTELAGEHFELRKGLSYKGTNLVGESEVGLLTIDAFITGGGYKRGAEKPFEGDYKSEYIAEPGDVLLAMTEQQEGLLASPLKVPEDLGGMTELIYSLDVAKVISKTGKISPEFLFNFLRVPLNRRRASYGDTGTTVQRLPYDVIYEQQIPFPSVEEQDKINSFIATLDRKIELNTALASTLEKIAYSLFRSWFIDFDPVKAKMAGEKPVGMDAAIAALFPDSMEDSELGKVPSGWTVRDFGDVNNLLMGQSPPGDTYNTDGDGVPFYQGRTDFGMRFPKQRVFCTAGTRFASAGDVLVSVRAPVGDLNQAIEDCVIGRGVASVLHKSGSQAYSYALLSSLKPKLAYYNGEGTVFGAINRSDFTTLKVIEPSPKLIEQFDSSAAPLNDQIRNLFVQTESLIQLRDSLLPRLISGELQIPEEMLVS